MSMSIVARGAPRAETACAPKTYQGTPASARLRTARVSPSADMRGPVEEPPHAQVRLEVGLPLPRIRGTPGEGSLVQRDRDAHLLCGGQPGALTPRQPL